MILRCSLPTNSPLPSSRLKPQLHRHQRQNQVELKLSLPPPDALSSLSPKEITSLLVSQPHWRSALDLLHLLRSLPSYRPNTIHYNVVLRRLALARQWRPLLLLWLSMSRDSLPATNHTYSSLLHSFSLSRLPPNLSLLCLRHMLHRRIPPDEITASALLRLLKDSRLYSAADRFFQSWLLGLDQFPPDLPQFPHDDDHNVLAELFRSGARPPPSAIPDSPPSPRTPRLASTYNALIDLYGKAGWLDKASAAFADMLRSDVAPDTTTFNTMIHICGSSGRLDEAAALLDKMEERGLRPDVKTFNVFMSLSASTGDTDGLLRYYGRIRECRLRPDTVTYRIILRFMCKQGMVQEAESVIEEMELLNVAVDEQSFPVITEMYVREGLPLLGKRFLEKHCFGRDVSSRSYAAIIDVYAEKGLWEEAEDVFNSRHSTGCKKDAVVFNVMIKAYGKAKLYEKAIALFESMADTGVWPDTCTYNSLIQMLAGGDSLDEARGLLVRMRQSGFKPRCETFSAIISSCSRLGLVSEAEEVFGEMKRTGVEPNGVVYGALINLFAEFGKVGEALRYYRMMEESGIQANNIILTSLIKAYGKVGRWQEAQEVYARMKDLDGGLDVVASNYMISLYSGLGMVCEAESVFDALRQNGQADGISYATMMHLYKGMGMLEETVRLSQDMQHAGLLTDCSSYNNVIASYASNGLMRECGELLRRMQEIGISPDRATFKVMFTVLRKGELSPEAVAQLEASHMGGKSYAKQAIMSCLFSVAGMLEDALKSCDSFMLAETPLDLPAYNAAIFAYGSCGKINRALNLLIRIGDEGLKPDIVTHINLAGCYGKAGLVEGIKRIYSKLKYGQIEPNESLYRAVIAAYKNVGKPELADMVDQEMRFSSNVQGEIDTGSSSE